METKIVNSIIDELEADAKRVISNMSDAYDPLERGYIRGYHDALMNNVEWIRSKYCKDE